MMNSAPVVYTIGHSAHPADYFLELLNAFNISCIVDVRSVAASAYNPQYNKEPLSAFLNRNNIAYHHRPEEFGARHHEIELLDEEGKVDFEKVRKTWHFKNGMDELWKLTESGERTALMCSESDPFDCHRFSMIAVALKSEGFEMIHILKDKTVKTQEELEQQLLRKYEKKLPKPDIFNPKVTREDQLHAAYRLRNKEIAYTPAHPKTTDEWM